MRAGNKRMSEEALQGYMRDVCAELVEMAIAAKAQARDGDEFESGRRMAFYEVLSRLVDQASAFSIDPESIGLAQAENPERFL